MVVIVLATVAIAGATIFRAATAQLRHELTDRNVQIARRAAEEIAGIISGARQGLQDIGDQLLFLNHEPWARGILLENQTLRSGIFSTVILVDSSGTVLADNALGTARIETFPPQAVNYAMAGESWTSAVTLDTQRLPTITMVQALSNGLALIATAVQVRDLKTGHLITQLKLPQANWSGIAVVGDALVLGLGSTYSPRAAGIEVLTPGGKPPVVPG